MSDLFQATMDGAYNRWQNSKGMTKQEFWDQLNADERIAVFCGNLNYQVENGGFSQWLDNGYATDETISFLLRFTAKTPGEAMKVVNQILYEFMHAVRRCGVDLSDPFGSMEEEDYNWFYELTNPLNSRFYDVNTAWVAEIEAHLQGMKAAA